jgi:hypothetical protein
MPVNSILDRINNPAVCQKVNTGPWNNEGINAFHKDMVTMTAKVIKPRPSIANPANFKNLNGFISVIY